LKSKGHLVLSFTSQSPQETKEIAQKVFERLPSRAILCFFGEMGVGKTFFIKALAEADEIPAAEVTSPTFTYLNRYEGHRPFFHFDLWRLNGPEDFIHQGFDEVFSEEGIVCIEWSEKIASILPSDAILIRIASTGETARKIEIEGALL
jgi:tRNA threonylcarbamoyladenosine biosynthesis protein TsaE